MGAGGVLFKATGAEVWFVMEGILSNDVTGGGLGWVLVVVVVVEGVLFKSMGADGGLGLEKAADTGSVVIADVVAVVILGIPSAEEEGVPLTVQAGDTVTGTSAEFGMGLQEVESNLEGGC